MKRTKILWLLIFWLAGSSCKMPGPLASLAPGAQVATQPAWDRVFKRDSGWTGGDVAASIIIPGDRVLWLFGDSWIGEVKDNRHVNAVLVNNSFAIQSVDPSQPGKAPLSDRIEFYWGQYDASGKPSAWLSPGQVPGKPKTWYWPTGGAVVAPDADGNKRLALFLLELQKKRRGDDVWGFECVGSRMALVEDVSTPARSWKPVVIGLPHGIAGGAFAGDQIDWGVAALYLAGANGSPGYVLIYGVAADRENNRELLLARARPDAIEQFGAWEFFAGDGKWGGSLHAAQPIAKGIASELSVDRIIGRSGESFYVMVYSEPFLGDRIFARTAPAAQGPWSDARAVFMVAEAKKSPTLFAYAAKGHAGLSRPCRLLVSYLVNSNDFNELVNDASIYRPRFISVPLDMIGVRLFPGLQSSLKLGNISSMVGSAGINGKQVLVIGTTALVLLIMMIYPPWKISLGYYSENIPGGADRMEAENIRRYGPIWRPPKLTPEEEKEWGTSKPVLDLKVLLVQLIPAIMIGVLFHQSFKSRMI